MGLFQGLFPSVRVRPVQSYSDKPVVKSGIEPAKTVTAIATRQKEEAGFLVPFSRCVKVVQIVDVLVFSRSR